MMLCKCWKCGTIFESKDDNSKIWLTMDNIVFYCPKCLKTDTS